MDAKQRIGGGEQLVTGGDRQNRGEEASARARPVQVVDPGSEHPGWQKKQYLRACDTSPDGKRKHAAQSAQIEEQPVANVVETLIT